MASTLLNHLRSVFNSSAIADLSQTLNENPASTQKAIDGLIPALTGGVANLASEKGGAVTVYGLLQKTPFDTEDNLGELLDSKPERQKAAESGNNLLKQLYGERVNRLAEATAQYSNISLGSAATLTGLVMSVLMGYLHKQVTTQNLTEAQLAALLHGEADSVLLALPTALAGTLGWFLGSPVTPPVVTPIPVIPVAPVREEVAPAAGLLWWQWLLIGLGVLAILLLLMRSCGRDTTTARQTNEPGVAAATDTVASDMNGNGANERVTVDLPGDKKLSVIGNSFNYSLARLLADEDNRLPATIPFDNLTFEPETAKIVPQDQSNVNDLIQIMTAYPTLDIRIEGLTGSTGASDDLAKERADALRQALIAGGINAGRMTTQVRPISTPGTVSTTDSGDLNKRLIDVVVTKFEEFANGPKVRVAVDAPGGRKLILTDRSFNYQLATYLATEGSQPNKSFLFDNLRFDTNTARIGPAAQKEVDDLIQIMNVYPSLNILVVGHTDDVAGSDINMPLSAARANFVKDALVKGGIDANRITTHKEGATEPIATNETAAGRQRNRRVEIVITQL